MMPRCNSQILAALFLLLAVLGCRAASNEAVDYLPLQPGTRYHYQARFDGRTELTTLIVRPARLGDGTPVAVFIDGVDASLANPVIGPNGFGLGAYAGEANKLITWPAFWLRELDALDRDDGAPLLPDALRAGTSLQLAGSDTRGSVSMTFREIADVDVRAGHFQGCAVIDIEERWPSGARYESTVWLAPGVGMVRWKRSTGRIDELLRIDLPPSALP